MSVKKFSKMLILCLCAVFFFSADPPAIKLVVAAPYLVENLEFPALALKEYSQKQAEMIVKKSGAVLVSKTPLSVKATSVQDYYEKIKAEAKKSGASIVLASVIIKSLSVYLLDVALIKVSSGEIVATQLRYYQYTSDLVADIPSVISALDSDELGLEQSTGSIEMWSFTDEINSVVTDFEKRFPDTQINVTITPASEYVAKIQPVLAANKGAPDIFTAEAAFYKLFIDTGYWEDIGVAPYNGLKLAEGRTLPFILAASKDDDGKLRSLTWQATAGSLIVRRDIAKEVLGTDDPAAVSKYTSTWKGFWELAGLISDKTGGLKYISADLSSELFRLAFAGRKTPWVVDNKFVIDPVVETFIKEAKKARDNDYDAQYQQWSRDWSDSMENGDVFGYVLPTWGLHYVVKPNAPKQKGNYMLVTPPVSYYWGGTWLGIYSKAKPANKMIAWDFIKMLCLDDEYMEGYAKKTGDFISNMKVLEKIKGTFKDEFLKGQNHYAYYYDEAKKINGSLTTGYDQTVEQAVKNRFNEYLTGDITSYDALIKAIKSDVKTAYPDVKVN